MKRTNRYITILAGVISCCTFVIEACKKQESVIKFPTPVSLDIPKGFPAIQYNFTVNPLTKEGIELGRRLFYEGKLSKDGYFPCASCHQQFAAFATYEHDLSHGFNNQFTTRNAPGLFNLAWQKEFMWDGGINHLDVQPLAPITAPNEMAEDLKTVVQKLKDDTHYPPLFLAAFGTSDITSQRMLWALSQFMVSLVSANSKYDQMKRGEAVFSGSEQKGYEIFKVKCAHCHQEPLFTDNSYRNNGLLLNTYLNDYGRMGITQKNEDSLKFKVPSLRNVALTFPYMHDGRFWKLTDVLKHYVSGMQQGGTLDPNLNGGVTLSAEEQAHVVSFLNTLTDTTFIKNPQFAQPG